MLKKIGNKVLDAAHWVWDRMTDWPTTWMKILVVAFVAVWAAFAFWALIDWLG